MDPASTSAWVIVYVAVQSMTAFGASAAGVAGVQLTAERPGIGSVTVTLCRVTVPVFWPWSVYVTTVPATTPEAGRAVFVRVAVPTRSVLTVALPELLTGLLLGSRPAIVAVFENEPASTSAWVTV